MSKLNREQEDEALVAPLPGRLWMRWISAGDIRGVFQALYASFSVTAFCKHLALSLLSLHPTVFLVWQGGIERHEDGR